MYKLPKRGGGGGEVIRAMLERKHLVLSDPGKPGVRLLGRVVRKYVQDLVVDLNDVTLADEDTNSILTDNANRAM